MKKISIITLFVILVIPNLVFAQNEPKDSVFQAEVIEVIEQKEVTIDNELTTQQDIKLRGLNGDFKDKEIEFNGIGDIDVIKKNIYEKGDLVLANASYNDKGEVAFFITDYVRNKSIAWLFYIFLFTLLLVGGWKGLRAIVSLSASFVVIIYYIIPQILSGADAVIVTIIGSVAILVAVVYLTEGFNKESNIASLSIFLSLLLTVFLSWFFVELAKLSGTGSEEIAYLINLKDVSINFKGLLLSGIIVGTLGVLDDVVISQIMSVRQIHEANTALSKKEVFQSAYKVGVSHISSMANTLFLAYTGASFPLLILFFSGESAFKSFFEIINNESIATEVVRTLAGSVGLILAVPISTCLAVVFIVKRGK